MVVPWHAGDLDGDSLSTTFGIEETEFSVTCGCATGSSPGGGTLSEPPTFAPTPGPTPSPTVSGCKAGDPFLVTLPAVPQVEGCFVDSNVNDTAGYSIYRSTGGAESAEGQSFVLPTGDGPELESYYASIGWKHYLPVFTFSRNVDACVFSTLLLHRVSVAHFFFIFPVCPVLYLGRIKLRVSWRGTGTVTLTRVPYLHEMVR